VPPELITSSLTLPYHSPYFAIFGRVGFYTNDLFAWLVPQQVVPAVLLLPAFLEPLINIQAVRKRRAYSRIEVNAMRINDCPKTILNVGPQQRILPKRRTDWGLRSLESPLTNGPCQFSLSFTASRTVSAKRVE
jgi:hypothetical protein